MKLNKRISQLRKGLRQNQEDMAKGLGITRSHYNKVETGKKFPSMDLLEKIAEVTNTNLTILLEDRFDLPKRIDSKCETRAALGMAKFFDDNDVFEKEIKEEILPIKKSKGLSPEDIAAMVSKTKKKPKTK